MSLLYTASFKSSDYWCAFGTMSNFDQYVCPSIFGNSARTAGPIGPGVAPFDAPKRLNDDGACHEWIGGTWHMAHAAA